MTNLEGKAQKSIADTQKNFLVPNNCVVVCPWTIRTGFQNIAEVGFLPANADPYWYGFFQKVFTGNQIIIATWDNSTSLSKVTGAYRFQYDFQVGTYYQGAMVVGSAEYSTEIEAVEGNQDFLAMKNASSVTIRFEGWVPSEKDMYKLYTIPEMYGGKWYYISNVKALNDLNSKLGFSDDYTFNDTSIPVVEVTFTSLVDKLQVSGKAVEQYVQYAGVGEPYVIPLVAQYNANYDETATDKQFIEPTKYVGYIPYQPQSANYLQVELQGANAFSAVEVEGRTLTWNSTTSKWESTPWKRLLAHNTVANQVNELNRTSLPSRNFYFFPNETLSFITSKTFQEDNKTREDALAMNQSAGKMSMGGTGDWTSLGNGEHKSNPATTDDTHFDYNNTNWKPVSYFLQDYPRNTQGNFYAVSDLTLKQTDTFVDILNKNSFIYETQPIIPLGFMSSKPYHIGVIPLVGKMVSKFWGDMTINPNTTQRKPLSIGYFIDCDIAGMIANIYSSQPDNTVWAPLSALVGDETKASKYLGTTALNTTLTFSLTDRVSENGTEYNTIYFGQTKKEDGTTNILADGSRYYYGRTNQVTLQKNTNDMFVIDSVTVYALHKGKIKLTAFSDLSNPIWTTTVQSKANWTNSIRDWATTISCGGWGEDYCNWTISDFPWPARPDKITGTEISINYDNTWNINEIAIGNAGLLAWRNASDPKWRNGLYDYGRYDEGEEDKYRGVRYWRTTQTQTNTTSYADLNVGITTREQFKAYFKEMVLYVSGKIDAQKQPILETKQTEIPITIGTSNTYTGEYIVGQLGDQRTGITIPRLAVNDSETVKKALRGYAFKDTFNDKWADTGGVTTHFTYTITLNESNIVTTIQEEDWLVNWGNDYYGDFVDNVISNNTGYTFATREACKNIVTNVKVPKLRLVEKEHTLTLSGGSLLMLGTEGQTGSDNHHWSAYYDLQELPDGTVKLYNAPSGVSITDQGTIYWDDTLTTGQHQFFVYASYADKLVYEAVTLQISNSYTLTIEGITDPQPLSIQTFLIGGQNYIPFTVKLNGEDISSQITRSHYTYTHTYVEGETTWFFDTRIVDNKPTIYITCSKIYLPPTVLAKATYDIVLTVTLPLGYSTITATKSFKLKIN